MSAVRTAWQEVGARLEALGLKLKLHFGQARHDEVAQTVDQLQERVRDAFEAAGHAMKDDAVRADVREVGRLVAEALGTTLNRVGDDLREAASRKP